MRVISETDTEEHNDATESDIEPVRVPADPLEEALIATCNCYVAVVACGVIWLQMLLFSLPPTDGARSSTVFVLAPRIELIAMLIVAVPVTMALAPGYLIGSWGRDRVQSLIYSFGGAALVPIAIGWRWPFTAFCLMFIAAVCGFFLSARFAPKRPIPGYCPRCRYDLRGALRAGCPECGWNRTTSAPRAPDAP